MPEDNRKEGDSIGEGLLKEISITVKDTEKYIRSVLVFFLFLWILLLVFVILVVKVESISNNFLVVAVPFVFIGFIPATFVVFFFMFKAGMQSHELLQNCKRQLKPLSTVREIELVRLVTDLRNLFILNGAGIFTAFIIWIITIFMINRIKKDLKLKYPLN